MSNKGIDVIKTNGQAIQRAIAAIAGELDEPLRAQLNGVSTAIAASVARMTSSTSLNSMDKWEQEQRRLRADIARLCRCCC